MFSNSSSRSLILGKIRSVMGKYSASVELSLLRGSWGRSKLKNLNIIFHFKVGYFSKSKPKLSAGVSHDKSEFWFVFYSPIFMPGVDY